MSGGKVGSVGSFVARSRLVLGSGQSKKFMYGRKLEGEESLEAGNARANDGNADFDRRPIELRHQDPCVPSVDEGAQ